MDKKGLTFAEQFKLVAQEKRRKNAEIADKRRNAPVDLKKVRAVLQTAQAPKKFWG